MGAKGIQATPKEKKKHCGGSDIVSRALLARNDKLSHPPFIIPYDAAGTEWGSKNI